MASFKALCLAGVASLAVIATAHAADLLPPPPPVEYQPPPPPVVGGGWYLRGDVGIGTLQLNNPEPTFKGATPPGFAIAGTTIDEQVIAGAGFGYQFNSYFRADVTGEYHFASRYQGLEVASGCTGFAGGAVECVDAYESHISNGVFLINGYIDLGTWYHLTPYVGAGVGVALNTFSSITDTSLTNGGAGTGPSQTTTSFAYAFMAGVAYDLTPNLKLDVGYRYLDAGHASSGAIACNVASGCPYERQNFHLVSHDVRLGLRYTFADLIPNYVPQMPLIRKY